MNEQDLSDLTPESVPGPIVTPPVTFYMQIIPGKEKSQLKCGSCGQVTIQSHVQVTMEGEGDPADQNIMRVYGCTNCGYLRTRKA